MTFKEIYSKEDLARFLKTEVKNISYLLYVKSVDSCYNTFYIEKNNGEKREINSPSGFLKHLQKILADELQKYYCLISKNNKLVHAFLNNKSILSNAYLHKNKKILVHLDLKDFFESFHFGRIKGYLMKSKYFGLTDEIASMIANLVCYKKRLPQGAPTSPILTNFVFGIVDSKILQLAKNYKLTYTRYADDLVFSTNDKEFNERYNNFIAELTKLLLDSGFKVNERKTCISYKNNRQVATGIIVNNRRLSVRREYYKETRSMAHEFIKTTPVGDFSRQGLSKIITGRFLFICQPMYFKNEINLENGRETNNRIKDFQKFLYFTKFYNMKKPLIITEGLTDALYIKAALLSLKEDFPNLIKIDNQGNIVYQINFLKRTTLLDRLFKFSKYGADAFKNFSKYCINENSIYNQIFKLKNQKPKFPIIAVFDNEFDDSNKPISKFMKGKSEINELKRNHILENFKNTNLNILTIPTELANKEIEDLFDESLLQIVIDGRKFDRKDKTGSKETFGKKVFAEYVFSNYKTINFDKFRPLLENINNIVVKYKVN